MLAERKQKIKWCPNPCGNLWAKDENKFGQKMLEKFGWTPGKGLGAQEQGITAPVRLKCNSTQKGLGYDRGSRVHIFKHQEEFNSILSDLNSTEPSLDSDAKDKCLSLEQKSKLCKTRVHYHKFTRGKDLSRYSEKDLSCILGGLPEFRLNSAPEGLEDDDGIANDNIRPSLLSHEEGIIKEEQHSLEMIDSKKDKRKKKKKKKHNDLVESSTLENTCINDEINLIYSESTIIDDEIVQSNRKKKKRKHTVGGDVIIDNSIVLHALNEINYVQMETESLDIINSDEPTKKKKKKHKKSKLV